VDEHHPDDAHLCGPSGDDQHGFSRPTLYLSSALAAVALAFAIFEFSFDPAGAADRHVRRQTSCGMYVSGTAICLQTSGGAFLTRRFLGVGMS